MRVILIGGTSHAGKSTLATHLARRLGWTAMSTDKLARHPGRPWRPSGEAVPPHVAEHYLTLTVDELIASVMPHYRQTVWPLASALIGQHVADGAGLVLEGSALWPEDVAALAAPEIGAVWLTGDPAFLRGRILAESGYAMADDRGRAMIDSFADRAHAFDTLVVEAARKLGLPVLATSAEATPERLTEQILGKLGVPD